MSGDEPFLLKQRLPQALVLVGRRRAALAEVAVGRGAEVLVMDASNPLGNGRLLPRGPLRENLSALGRIGLLWLTRIDLAKVNDSEVNHIRTVCGGAPVESAYAPAAGAPELRGKRAFLFAGIARPASFEALARALGAEVAGTRWFPDHHWFTAADLHSLQAAAGSALLLTTEKDLVRLPAAFPALALPVELRILAGAATLDAALDAALTR